MSGEPQLYRIDPQSNESERITEVDFSNLGFRERQDIQEWLAANPGILDDDLLIIGKEFSGFDLTNERLDLLAVDGNGKLVIVELKRDDSGTDAHWQAIKYASYFQRATAEEIVDTAADYWKISQEEALPRILQHLGADDLNALNNDQRIILASHRFSPEVTSAALWLNQKTSGEDSLITCVKLTPHRDTQNGALYVQASTIIPVPGVDDYLIGLGKSSGRERGTGQFHVKLADSFAQSRNHEATPFVRKATDMALSGLPREIKPDRTGRWAGNGGDRRYYHLWYSRPPWGNWKVHYAINLYPQEEPGKWAATVSFDNRQKIHFPGLESITLETQQSDLPHGTYNLVRIGQDVLTDEFATRIAGSLRDLIVHFTPIVDDYGNEVGEQEA